MERLEAINTVASQFEETFSARHLSYFIGTLAFESDKLRQHTNINLNFSITDVKYIIANNESEHSELRDILSKNTTNKGDLAHIEFKTVDEITV